MYPSETSLIPVTVALARFVENNGLFSMMGQYPYWYLGVPFRFLTGPIIPLLQLFFHRTFPNVSLFSITIYIVLFGFLLSAIGWGFLVGKIQNSNFKIQIFGIGHLAFIILLVLPWRLFSSLTLNEASITLARNFLPWVLLAFWGNLKKGDMGDRGDWRKKVVAILALSTLLLVNTSILPIFLVGLTSLVLASSFKEGRFRGITKRIKSSLSLILYSLLLVTLWYTPGYWITVLANPSIGGASGIKVIFRILDLLKTSLPLVLAVITVYFTGKIKNRLTVFVLIWILTFGFLTLLRFIGDPDFWMDWTGVALLLSNFILSIPGRLKTRNDKFQMTNDQSNSKSFGIGNLLQGSKLRLTFIILILMLPFYLTWRFHLVLGRPKLISQDIPQGVQSLNKLAQIADQKSVFLSGSTVFWANAIYDIYQLRGGRDQVAVHPNWDKGAFELREGKDPEASLKWLNELNINYVLVHGPKSPEFYHDFRNINKWKYIGNVVWEDGGDVIYQIPK